MHQTYGAASAARPPEPNDSPFCPQCGSPLRLIRVEPIRGCEKHTLPMSWMWAGGKRHGRAARTRHDLASCS